VSRRDVTSQVEFGLIGLLIKVSACYNYSVSLIHSDVLQSKLIAAYVT